MPKHPMQPAKALLDITAVFVLVDLSQLITAYGPEGQAAPQGRIIGVAEGTASKRPSGQEAAVTDTVAPSEGQIKPSIDFAALDAQHRAAVESGDMETAQRLVDEAAQAAVPDGHQRLIHTSPNEIT